MIDKIMSSIEGSITTLGKITCFVLREFYDDVESEREVYDISGKLIGAEQSMDKSDCIGTAYLKTDERDIAPLIRYLQKK